MIWSPARYNSSRPLGDHAGDDSTAVGDQPPFAAGRPARGKRPDIHLESPRLIRRVGKPPAVRRKRAVLVGVLGREEPLRLPGFQSTAVGFNRNGPDLRIAVRLEVGEPRAVPRESGRNLDDLPACSTCGWPAPSARLHRRPLPNIP